MDRRSRVWVYVSLVAIAALPFLDLLYGNLDQGLDLGALFRYWLLTAATLMLLAFIAGRAGTLPQQRVAVVLVVAAWLFFHFPIVANGLGGLGVDPPIQPLAWWILAIAVMAALVPLSRYRPVRTIATRLPLLLLIVPLLGLTTSLWQATDVDAAEQDGIDIARPDRELPNIYFFLMDGYGRPNLLEPALGIDLSGFIGDLETQGFHVAEDSMANYPLTYLSIASTLDMDYLVEEGRVGDRSRYTDRIRGDNATVDALRSLDYAYVHSHPAWTGSECSGLEDLCLDNDAIFNDTEWAVLRRTPVAHWFADSDAAKLTAIASDPVAVTRRVLDHDPEAPFFLFAHMLNPHPPYWWDEDCAFRPTVHDPNGWGNATRFAASVQCANQQLLEAVDMIVAADPTAVVIIQGDHGPNVNRPDDRLPKEEFRKIRMSILSAIRLPPPCEVADDLTPVNTFRIVLNCIADAGFEILPNRSYWTWYDTDEVTPYPPDG